MKRYYRRRTRFPDGIDRLEAEVRGGRVTAGQIARWVDELFLEGGMKQTVGYVILRHGAWEEAMAVGREDTKTSFRAVWALEWAYEQAEPEELPEWFLDRITDDFCASPNGSVHRIYAKMLCDMMRFGGANPTDEQVERLAEKCFDLVIGPQTKTAAKFWCLETLAEIASRVEWVAEELPQTIRRISEADDCSPGMRVATREILKRLGAGTGAARAGTGAARAGTQK